MPVTRKRNGDGIMPPLLAEGSELDDVIRALNALDVRVQTQESFSVTTNKTLEGLQEAIDTLNTANTTQNAILDEIRTSLETNKGTMQLVNDTMVKTNAAILKISQSTDAATRVIIDYQNRFERYDKAELDKIIVIEGFPECQDENLVDDVEALLVDTGMKWGVEMIESVSRQGAGRPQHRRIGVNADQPAAAHKVKARPVKVVFNKSTCKTEVMRNLKYLRDAEGWTGISIGDQLDEVERREFNDLRSIYFLAKAKGQQAKLRQRAVIINDRSYSHVKIPTIPYAGINLEEATTALTQDGTMFRSEHNKLSNLYPCEIQDGEMTYSSVEQAFQHTKALCCGDQNTAGIIMSLTNTYTMMATGKKVKENTEWKKKAEQELHRFNVIKFQQPDLRDHLKKSYGHLYEASLHPVWGCGYHLGQKNICVQANIRTGNLHGKLLERIRDGIIKADTPQVAQPVQ